MGRRNLNRTLWIVASGLAALLVLWPPWQGAEGSLLGYGPLFSPLQYTMKVGEFKPGVEPTYAPGGYHRDSATGRTRYEEGRVIEPGQPAEYPTYVNRPGTIAWGRLLTQLSVLAVITGVVAALARPQI